eukprot:CAMPEP_0184694466 /NCGR_PEP_ID=MMETSP0313-20130426/2414_1 /TAXON_ID=2792 /ORGANISM="Porphyridium aerugineum, Strain SAG 1380-2" /LENGTH=730 /DNA_ID=CAMNT_0027152761 /DNA_START=267 /DNA_END=2459 /DNA_ORIENTATION=+
MHKGAISKIQMASSTISPPVAQSKVDVDNNPLLSDATFPRFGLVTASHVKPAIEHTLAYAESQIAALETSLQSKLDNKQSPSLLDLIQPLEKIQDRLGRVWGTVTHLKAVKDSDDLRKAVEEIQPKVVAFGTRVAQSKPIYLAFKTIQDDANAYSKLTDGQKRIVDKQVRSAQLGGVGLEGAKKERFNEIKLELANLSTKFGNNVLDSTKAFALVLTSKDEVAGLPPSWLAAAAQTARSKGHENANATDGPWVVTLDFPSYMPFMQFAQHRDLREKVYKASLTKASELAENVDHDVNNIPICEKILSLRKELAQILDYDNFAQVSLASKMATFDEAISQMESLRVASFEKAKEELAELQAFAEKDGFQGDLKHWDVTYYAERLKEATFTFQEEALRPYFALENVLAGLFSLVKRLFGVDIVEAKGVDVSLWDSSVRVYQVMSNNETIAYFYLDPFTRPAEKRGGAWMDSVAGRSTLLAGKDQSVRLPIAHMVCNQTPPVDSTPSLMTLREVETLFHELGHALQHMLTKEDGLVAGINGIEWDCVEIPSTFMEHWVYDKATLLGLAKHYQTGETLPLDLYNKIVQAKNFRAGSMMLRQVHFSLVDLELHSRYDPSTNSMLDFEREIGTKTLVMPAQPYDRFLCAFSHIFAGGYSAGYYSYKYAEILSADAFAAFDEAGLENQDKVKEIGLAFRNTILGLGGAKSPLDVFILFRGRKPDPHPLLKYSGLVAA